MKNRYNLDRNLPKYNFREKHFYDNVSVDFMLAFNDLNLKLTEIFSL